MYNTYISLNNLLLSYSMLLMWAYQRCWGDKGLLTFVYYHIRPDNKMHVHFLIMCGRSWIGSMRKIPALVTVTNYNDKKLSSFPAFILFSPLSLCLFSGRMLFETKGPTVGPIGFLVRLRHTIMTIICPCEVRSAPFLNTNILYITVNLTANKCFK